MTLKPHRDLVAENNAQIQAEASQRALIATFKQQISDLTRERDALRAEVERLTAERDAALARAEMAGRLAEALRAVIRPDVYSSPHGPWSDAATVLAEYDALVPGGAGQE